MQLTVELIESTTYIHIVLDGFWPPFYYIPCSVFWFFQKFSHNLHHAFSDAVLGIAATHLWNLVKSWVVQEILLFNFFSKSFCLKRSCKVCCQQFWARKPASTQRHNQKFSLSRSKRFCGPSHKTACLPIHNPPQRTALQFMLCTDA